MPSEQTTDSRHWVWATVVELFQRLLLFSGTLLLLVIPIAVVSYWIANIGLQPITQIKVSGENIQHLSRQQLQGMIAPQARKGFFGMDARALRQSLQAVAWIRDASMRRVWPDGLDIELQEQRPQARWRSGELLSVAGQRFRPPPESIPDGLPWLDGAAGDEQRVLEQYRRFAQVLATTGLGIYALTVDQRGSWKLILDNRLELLLGRERTAQRLWRLAQVYNTMVKPKANTIRRVDLRYSNGFAVSWRNDQPSTP